MPSTSSKSDESKKVIWFEEECLDHYHKPISKRLKNHRDFKSRALIEIKMCSSNWGRDGGQRSQAHIESRGKNRIWMETDGETSIHVLLWSRAAMSFSKRTQRSIPVPSGPRTWCSSLNGYETSIFLSKNTDEACDPWLLKAKRAQGTHSTSTPAPVLLSGCITRHIQLPANYFTRFPGVIVTVDMATTWGKIVRRTGIRRQRWKAHGERGVRLKSHEAGKEATSARTKNRSRER